MQFKNLALAALTAAPALADFQVYCGDEFNGFDGTGDVVDCFFFNHADVSCDDVVFNSVPHISESDVSGNCGGMRCAGCDKSKSPRDWDITELEFNDSQGCSPSHQYWSIENQDGDLHFTIYHNGDSVSIIGSDGQDYGHCSVPSDPQQVQCSDALGNFGLSHHFDCQSPLQYLG